MHFRTTFDIPPAHWKIAYGDSVVSIGSCFADCIGNQLISNKINAIANPFGTVFNPRSLFWQLEAQPAAFEKYYLERDGAWYNYQLHSSCVAASKTDLQALVSEQCTRLQTQLTKAKCLIITLGTAWIYELAATQESVANCHKQAATLFNKRLLTVTEIQVAFEKFYEKLQQSNPDIQIVLTVSPVRHLKDTLPLNAVSKATLRLVCHALEQAHENVSYFPAYELLTDDLRDYRFYADDLIHPSAMAEKYIWEKFVATFFAEKTQQQMAQWQAIQRDLAHKPFLPQSAAHQKFLKKLLEKMNALAPHLDLSEEIKRVVQQITTFEISQ
jgi:lysophospholipase L1-like esterase